MRRTLVALGTLLAVVLAVVVANTLRFASHPVAVEPAPPLPIAPGLAERLAAAVRYRTVSFQDPAQECEVFLRKFEVHLGASRRSFLPL